MSPLIIALIGVAVIALLAFGALKYKFRTNGPFALLREHALANQDKQASALEHQVDDTIQRLILTAKPATARRGAL